MQKYEITLKHKSDSGSKLVSYLIFDVSKDFVFKEGQFVMLETELNGAPYKRAYSIASTQNDIKNGEICFYVKKVSEAGMSDFLTQKIKIGDKMTMSQSFGNMTNDFSAPNYLFISIGSGNACIKSIYQSVLEDGKYNRVYQLFGERFLDNLVPDVADIYQREIENVHSTIFISKDDIPEIGINAGNLSIKKGHVQDGFVEAVKFFTDKNIKVFMCGKPEMVDDMIDRLVQLGVSADNIKAEKY